MLAMSGKMNRCLRATYFQQRIYPAFIAPYLSNIYTSSTTEALSRNENVCVPEGLSSANELRHPRHSGKS